MIAVLIITAGFTAVIAALNVSIAGTIDSEYSSIAVNLARQRLEEMRNLSYDAIVNEGRDAVAGFSGFERQIATSEPLADLKRVTATVFWKYKGVDASIAVDTYFSRN